MIIKKRTNLPVISEKLELTNAQNNDALKSIEPVDNNTDLIKVEVRNLMQERGTYNTPHPNWGNWGENDGGWASDGWDNKWDNSND